MVSLIIKNAFAAINKLNDRLNNKTIEISIKRSQFELTFEEYAMITVEDLALLSNVFGDSLDFTDITCFNDRLFVSYRGLEDSFMEDKNVSNIFKDIYKLIVVLRDKLCTCPALECILSPEYIKVFIDVPNIQLSNINAVSDILEQDPFLEFGADRPYLLYINEELNNE